MPVRAGAVVILGLTHVVALMVGILLAVGRPGDQGLCVCAPDDHGRRGGVDVPYVPSPHEVVSAMLEFAGVTADDVVYDLGSGDGRIVIAAARDRGARGVGIEIDSELVAESRRNAVAAGVPDRVEFREQDFFQVDLRDATVVTLYLLPAVNRRLRPLLLEQLPPGARIVAHDYDMIDWPPHASRPVTVGDRTHMLFLWTVPERGGR